MEDMAEVIAPPAVIGFLGLGRMGLPMASRLVAAGFTVRGHDPVAAARTALAEAGGQACDAALAVAQGAEALITMLPDGRAVRAALLQGPNPLARRLAPGTLILEMSSSAPVGTRALAAELAGLGLALVDAPVSGGVARAVAGTLAIMAGGAADQVARAQRLLAALGEAVFATGPVGSGHAMKALNNLVSAAGLVAACEAVRIGERFGLDPMLMTDILNVSTGRNNSTEVKLKPFVLTGSYASGFALAHMAKDLRAAEELAERVGVAAPLTHACTALWHAALAALGEDADHTEIDRHLQALPPDPSG